MSMNPKLVKAGTGSNGDQNLYICPYCLINTGKQKAKFYWCTTKNIGHCYVCNTAVYRKRTIEEICNAFIEEKQIILPEYQIWNLSKWTYPIKPDSEHDKYLKGRGITDDLIAKYGIRYCNVPYSGIVLPNGDYTSTNFFQVRNMDKSAKLRYVNPSSTKPVYGMCFLEPKPEAVLCEGILSTISTDSPRYTSYGLYGKSISGLQLKDLLSTPTVLYNVCLDGGEILAIIRLIGQLLTEREVVGVILLPFGKDPNDIMSKYGKETFAKFYNSRVFFNKTKLSIMSSQFLKKEENESTWYNFCKAAKNAT